MNNNYFFPSTTLQQCFDTDSADYVSMMYTLYCDDMGNYKKSTGRELHHIIPRSYYKKMKLPIDNSENNLVSLLPSNHFKVHYYAFKCAKKIIKNSMAYAFRFMYQTSRNGMSEKDLQVYAEDYERARLAMIVTDETKRKISLAEKGRVPPNKGKHHTEETKRKLSEAKKGKHLTEETKRKLSLAKKCRHWIIVNGKRRWV